MKVHAIGKGGKVPEKKMGRPIIGQPKNIRVQLRFDEFTLKKLDELCKKEKMSRSEFIRKLIQSL